MAYDIEAKHSLLIEAVGQLIEATFGSKDKEQIATKMEQLLKVYNDTDEVIVEKYRTKIYEAGRKEGLETLALKFEQWPTLDIWRSDAAIAARSLQPSQEGGNG